MDDFSQQQVQPDGTSAPDFTSYSSYLTAADNHNYGNGNFSFVDPSTWGQELSNAGKFIVSSVASGLNSFYNTGVAVTNFFGAQNEYNDVANQLSDLDSDLGQYYMDNRKSADLAGFLLTSLLPGVAGVKILNAGQKVLTAAKTGLIGENMASGFGLLAPNAERYILKASQEFAQSNATFSAINGNVLKAVASGVGQAALESAAFETAVQATMHKSPVLEDQDVGDVVKNILYGTVTGAAIGGAFHTAGIYGKLKRAGAAVDETQKPWTAISELPEGVSNSERIIQWANDLQNMPAITDEMQNASRLRVLATQKTDKLNNLIRSTLQEMSIGGDTDAANFLADKLQGLGDTVQDSLFHSQQFGRLSTTLKVEKDAASIASQNGKIAKNTPLGEVPELISANPYQSVKYVKLYGEDAGQVFNAAEANPIPNLADTVVPIAGKTTEQLVDAAIKGYKFKADQLWNPLTKPDHLEAEARYIWADNIKPLEPGATVHEYDIPLLEKALQDGTPVQVRHADDSVSNLLSNSDIANYLTRAKQELATNLMLGAKDVGIKHIDEIAKIANVRRTFLEGEQSIGSAETDYFARQYYKQQVQQELTAKGLWNDAKGDYPLEYKPSWMKVSYDTTPMQGMSNMQLDAMTFIKAKEKLLQQSMDAVVNKYAYAAITDSLYRPGDDLLLKANRYGAGAGLFSSANGGYGTLASWAENTGSAVNKLRAQFKSETREVLQAPLYQLLSKPQAAIEFSALNQKLASTTERYVLERGDENNIIGLVAKKVQDFENDTTGTAVEPKLQVGAPERIKFQNPETAQAFEAHIARNGANVIRNAELRAAQGLEDTKDPNVFYPIRPDPRDYPHFAFVVDPTVTESGHVTMIHAATPNELEAMMSKVPAPFKVITKGESEDYQRALGNYQYERTLHDNYIDSTLQNRGINSQFIPQTDPQKIVESILNSHLRRDDVFARDLISGKFDKEFSELRRLGEKFTDVAASKYASNAKLAESSTDNPYLNYVKTALDISKASEYPLLQSFNGVMDSAFSRVTSAASSLFAKAKTPEELDKINEIFANAGLKSAYNDAATELLANHSAPKGALSNFVRKANALVSTLTLRLDPLNAITNAVGSTVLTGAETSNLLRGIRESNPEIAGKLSQLLQLNVPGTADVINNPGKLIAKNMAEFIRMNNPEKEAIIREGGWMGRITDQFRSMTEDLSLRGNESAGELQARLNSAFAKMKGFADKGEVWTGNKYAEEFNRYVSAGVAKDISDLGVKAGIMTPAEQTSYINTFVNRTQGNIIASQRPVMFQGPIGQAVGLFQSYQLNMMQQLFRYVGEGSTKDAALALGLQGTMFGLNGLPAFQAINQKLIGEASGNPTHKDLYDATYGIAGKGLGDFLMYGLPSNLLKTNLYSRGDINPRQVTIIPVNPADVPAISIASKVFGGIKDTIAKLGAGGSVWQTILQGIEHNSISRPLAGLAQTAQDLESGKVFSTSRNGSIVGSNDLMSLATLARIAGGRPLDEAIVNDAAFRTTAYSALDTARRQALDKAIRTSLIAGNSPSADQVGQFASEYAATGGKLQQFNQHMIGLFKNTNQSQAQQLANNLRSNFSQSMQQIMRGRIDVGFNSYGMSQE